MQKYKKKKVLHYLYSLKYHNNYKNVYVIYIIIKILRRYFRFLVKFDKDFLNCYVCSQTVR